MKNSQSTKGKISEEERKDKLRQNMAKARAARSEKARRKKELDNITFEEIKEKPIKILQMKIMDALREKGITANELASLTRALVQIHKETRGTDSTIVSIEDANREIHSLFNELSALVRALPPGPRKVIEGKLQSIAVGE